MIGTVVIDLAPAEGALPRVLGLVERRGFRLRGIAMAEGSPLSIDVEAHDPGRRFDVLALQLGRLSDVRSVSFSTPATSA
jgi:acetolactate synthase II small subunit